MKGGDQCTLQYVLEFVTVSLSYKWNRNLHKIKQARKNSVKNCLSKFMLLKKKVVDINNNNYL